VLPEACAGNQVLEHPLPAGSVLLNWKQLPWLLEAHTQMQIDHRASAAWWAPDDSSPLALLPHRYPQLATQCQEPATTHPCEPQAAGLANLLAPGGIPSHQAQRPSTPHCP
jgi:hypothetical protein